MIDDLPVDCRDFVSEYAYDHGTLAAIALVREAIAASPGVIWDDDARAALDRYRAMFEPDVLPLRLQSVAALTERRQRRAKAPRDQ